MTGLTAAISSNILILLRKKGMKQKDLAERLGVSKQIMSNMLGGSRVINAVELKEIADFLSVSMDSLMETPDGMGGIRSTRAFMADSENPATEESLGTLERISSMILYYSRIRNNSEALNTVWEP
jgi:transcriptional regulator with XRE-family HTH domain